MCEKFNITAIKQGITDDSDVFPCFFDASAPCYNTTLFKRLFAEVKQESEKDTEAVFCL